MSDSLKISSAIDSIDSRLASIKTSLNKAEIDKSFIGIPEDYWTHFILPVIIPLLLSAAGFYFGKRYANRNEKKEKLNALKGQQTFLITWVTLVKDQIVKQSQSFKDYSQRLNSLENYSVLGTVDLHLDKFDELSSSDLVALFITNRVGDDEVKSRLVFDFQNSLSVIKRQDKFSKSQVDSIGSFNDEINKEWNSAIHAFREIMQELEASYHTLPVPEKIAELFQLHAVYSKKKEPGMTAFWKYFLTEAGPICSGYIKKFPTIHIMRMLVNTLVKLRLAYESKLKFYQDQSKHFSESSQIIVESYEQMASATEELRKLKFKKLQLIS